MPWPRLVPADLPDALADLTYDPLLGRAVEEAASGMGGARCRKISNWLDRQNPKAICGRCSGPAT